MKTVALAGLALSVLTAPSRALDMSTLAPCIKPASLYCDRSAGMTTQNLMSCASILAAKSSNVGESCRAVLRRYGQL